MKPLKIYHECPICNELLDGDLQYARHLKDRHTYEIVSGDERLDGLSIPVVVIINDLANKEK